MDISIVNAPANAKVDLERWAKIVIEKWQYNVVKRKLVDSGQLLRSFTAHVTADAQNNRALISFAFQYYMRMLDMGVGKGVRREDVATLKRSRKVYGRHKANRREPKDIYNRTLYAEIMKLGELLTKQYATQGANVVINNNKNTNG